MGKMQEALRKAEAEQKRLIDEAREETRQTLGEVRSRVAEEVAIARRGLRESAEEVARIVAEKVLGRRV